MSGLANRVFADRPFVIKARRTLQFALFRKLFQIIKKMGLTQRNNFLGIIRDATGRDM